MYNILTEPLIRYRHSCGEVLEAPLPEVYAALMADEVEAFPALRPHQRHAWHAFLVQLGAMAMHRVGLDTPPTGADEWRSIIRLLTPEWPDDEPWQLVVDDITIPAFMQPPASSKDKEREFNKEVRTPDDLDIISTSRNHDVKTGSLERPGTDDWIFALLNVQTMDGRPGSGYYGVSRMNSNDGSRTAFSLTPSLRWGQHTIKDISSLLEAEFSSWPMRWDGIKLLWTEHWDGMKSEALTLDRLHPFYLEVCRRCRIKEGSDDLYALKGPKAKSGGCRVGAEASRGNVGDPWTLITQDDKGAKALTMQTNSFSYQNIVEYLFSPEWNLPALFDLGNSGKESNAFLVARSLRRKKGGQTEGYYERIIPLRHRTLQIFGRPGGPKTLEDISRERIQRISDVEGILRRSVATFAAGGKAKDTGRPNDIDIKDEHWSRAKSWVDKLTELMDVSFFEDLQDEALADDSQQQNERKKWLQKLADDAEGILYDAIQSLPCPAVHRPRAQARAVNVFRGTILQTLGLTELRQDSNEENEAWQTNKQPTQTDSPAEMQMTLFE